jgi:hypothetical protein
MFFVVTGHLELHGITLKNGWGKGECSTGPAPLAGAIQVSGSGSANITECTFAYNHGADGGAIAIGGGYGHPYQAVLARSTFTGNSAQIPANGNGYGGAILIIGNGYPITNFLNAPELVVKNCVFLNNIVLGDSTQDYGYGGAVAVLGIVMARIIGCTFTNNTGIGGAVTANNKGLDLIKNCTFKDNTSPYKGGACYFNGGLAPGFIDCIFDGNIASHNASDGGGGAIAAEGTPGPISLIGCSFVKPAETTTGNNDVSSYQNITIYCPEDATGAPVTVASPTYLVPAARLPPTTQVVHCTPKRKNCTGHPPACKCTGSSAALSEADCTAWQKLFDVALSERAPWMPYPWNRLCERLDPCDSGCSLVGCSNANTTITSFECDPFAFPAWTPEIPSEIGLFANLQHLTWLSGAGFDVPVGEIPSEIWMLSKLKNLSISGLAMGTLPIEIADLSNLESLEFNGGGFFGGLTGPIPSEIAKLGKLTDVQLRSNSLTGLVPALPFAQYTDACVLAAGSKYCTAGNQFSCPLPASAQQCKSKPGEVDVGVVCRSPGPAPLPPSCSPDFEITEVNFASASCSGTPGYTATYKSGTCKPFSSAYPSNFQRFCCNHDGSVVSYTYFEDQLQGECSCRADVAWNQTSGKCKKLSDTSSQLFTCATALP